MGRKRTCRPVLARPSLTVLTSFGAFNLEVRLFGARTYPHEAILALGRVQESLAEKALLAAFGHISIHPGSPGLDVLLGRRDKGAIVADSHGEVMNVSARALHAEKKSGDTLGDCSREPKGVQDAYTGIPPPQIRHCITLDSATTQYIVCCTVGGYNHAMVIGGP